MRIVVTLFISFILIITISAQGNINLSIAGNSNYKIILSSNPTELERQASMLLAIYLKDISDAEFSIVSDTEPISDYEISIGNTNRVTDKNRLHNLPEDAFRIFTQRNKLFFVAGADKGIIYSIYSFLEKYLNCRMYSPDVKIIPKNKDISLPQIDVEEFPSFSYRESFFFNQTDDEYSLWHKLDSHRSPNSDWGLWVHTFNILLPPQKYFESHPEYYALRNGIRFKDQLCLTNKDVLEEVCKNLSIEMGKKPQAKYWSVSQNDNFSNCTCPNCSRIDNEEGSASGSMISFVNKIAEKFPDKVISTLAYQYTRKPPKTIKPSDNVLVVLCSIECNRSKPIEKDPSSKDFYDDVVGWSKITNNILVWDYVIQFTNMVSPFPNFRVLQPNIQFFAKNNTKGMFEQGCVMKGSEFGDLRSYVISKLLWNTNINADSIVNDFLNGYYEEASTWIRKYMDTMHDALEKSKSDLLIYGSPAIESTTFLTQELLDEYINCFNNAENAVKNKPEILDRVKCARLPLEYALIDLGKTFVTGKYGYYEKNKQNKWVVKKSVEERIKRFLADSKKYGVTMVEENNYKPEAYIADVREFINKSLKTSLSFEKNVLLSPMPSVKYYSKGEKTLTDGIRGTKDYRFNWIGYEAQDFSATIDLGKTKRIKNVMASFLSVNNSWIFQPSQVIVSYSKDGMNFTTIKSFINDEPKEKEKDGSHEYIFKKNIACRYIKVEAMNRNICPPWHNGAGGKAWLFIDEIEIH